MLPGREVRAEHTGALAERRGLQPDVLITAAGRSPVVIEAEYEPAANVEVEATSRLGREATVGRPAHRGRHRPSLSRSASLRW